jgi:hypothetical protein
MAVFGQRDASVDDIVMATLQGGHPLFDFGFPPRGHGDVAGLDF